VSGDTERGASGGQATGGGPDPVAGGAAPPEAGAGFRLELPAFEGPLDLLLHLIEREELDVTEVSLLAVTEQYLAQIRSQERIDVSVLAEFIVIGARLLLLKSRALLPRDDETEQDEEAGDELADLIAALREYRRFKEAANYLRERDRGHASYRREAPPPKVPLPSGLDDVTLGSLTDVIRDVLARLPEVHEPVTLEREPVRLADRIGSLVDILERERRTPFRALIERAQSRTEVIVDFMAVLELIKSRYLTAEQPEAFGEIELVRIEGASIPDATELAEDYVGA
jgi:segregation and condensation protein A